MRTIIRSGVFSTSAAGLIRFLRNEGIRVVGTDIVPEEYIASKLDGYRQVPVAREEEQVINAYVQLVDEIGASTIVSGPESEVVVLARHVDDLQAVSCDVFHNPIETLNIMVSKEKLYSFLSQRRIAVPTTFLLDSYIEGLQGRIVIKPAEGRGAQGVHVTDVENIAVFRRILGFTNKYIVQEYLPGPEYTVDTLHDRAGILLNAVVRRRIMVESGVSTVAETLVNEDLVAIVERISGFCQFYGGNCFQFIQDGARYLLTDANPRLGGGCILSVHASRSFRNNLVNALLGRFDEMIPRVNDVTPMVMKRYYAEEYSV